MGKVGGVGLRVRNPIIARTALPGHAMIAVILEKDDAGELVCEWNAVWVDARQ